MIVGWWKNGAEECISNHPTSTISLHSVVCACSESNFCAMALNCPSVIMAHWHISYHGLQWAQPGGPCVNGYRWGSNHPRDQTNAPVHVFYQKSSFLLVPGRNEISKIAPLWDRMWYPRKDGNRKLIQLWYRIYKNHLKLGLRTAKISKHWQWKVVQRYKYIISYTKIYWKNKQITLTTIHIYTPPKST